MTNRVKSTTEEYLESLSSEERKEFDREFRNLALSELVLAAMEEDEESVRELAEMAEVSPSVVQALRSAKKDDFSLRTVLTILDRLGFRVLLE